MTNHKVIDAFIKGAIKGKSSNLTIKGDCLLSYSTCICQRVSNSFLVNTTKYSVTTTKAVNYLIQKLPILATRMIKNVRMGSDNLKEHEPERIDI